MPRRPKKKLFKGTRLSQLSSSSSDSSGERQEKAISRTGKRGKFAKKGKARLPEPSRSVPAESKSSGSERPSDDPRAFSQEHPPSDSQDDLLVIDTGAVDQKTTEDDSAKEEPNLETGDDVPSEGTEEGPVKGNESVNESSTSSEEARAGSVPSKSDRTQKVQVVASSSSGSDHSGEAADGKRVAMKADARPCDGEASKQRYGKKLIREKESDSESDASDERATATFVPAENGKKQKDREATSSSSQSEDSDLPEDKAEDRNVESSGSGQVEEKEKLIGSENKPESDSSLTSLEDREPVKQKRGRKPKKSEEKPASSSSVANARLTKLKRYAHTAGLRPSYKKLFADCATDKQRIRALETYLQENGLTGKLTLEVCKKMAKKRAIEKEISELDTANIIQGKRRTRAAGTSPGTPERSVIPPTASKSWKERVGLQSDIFSDSE